MSSHHPERHCFVLIDFTDAPIVVVTDFAEGERYRYDFTLFPTQLAGFVATSTGKFFNANIRHSAIPFLRIR